MIKLLFIDDEKGITDALQSFFGERGFYTRAANNGEDALKLVENEKFSIAFLDVRMKGMNGLEVLERMRKLDQDIKVLMLTVHEEKEIIEKAKSLGADECITKPFRVDYLENVVIKKIRELVKEK